MKQTIAFVGLLVVGLSAASRAQTPTSQQVDVAVANGLKGATKYGSKSCTIRAPVGFDIGYVVTIQGPIGRIAETAFRARGNGQPFSRSEIADDILSERLSVHVQPNPPRVIWNSLIITPPVTNAALQHKGKSVQPSELTLLPMTVTYVTGGQFELQGALAWFDRDLVPADFSVVVGSNDGRIRIGCPLSAKDVRRMFEPKD